MRYRKPDGTTFVLAHHSPPEWGKLTAERVYELTKVTDPKGEGNAAYAQDVAAQYEQAKPAE